MSALTPKQADLLAFIRQYQEYRHSTPSFEEMKEGLGLASKSGIFRMVNALQERGYIRRLPNRARAIEVVEKPVLIDRPAPQFSPLRDFSTSAILRELDRRGVTVSTAA